MVDLHTRCAVPAAPVAPTQTHAVVRQVVSAAAELLLIGAFFMLYRYGRLLARGEVAEATRHSRAVHHLEAVLHFPSEAAIQHALDWPWLLHAADVYYVSAHFPITIAFLVWGWVRRPRAEYYWARNLLMLLTGAALVIHMAYPLAPPRMFPQWGFLDSMRVYGPDAYAGASGSVANQFAAMPSLHIGWALVILYVTLRTGPRWVAALAGLHAATTITVVIITANHWWLDGVVAALLVTLATVVLPRPRTTPAYVETTAPVIPSAG